MKKDTDISIFSKNINDVGYTGDGDRPAERKAFLRQSS